MEEKEKESTRPRGKGKDVQINGRRDAAGEKGGGSAGPEERDREQEERKEGLRAMEEKVLEG
jgi:hypothetical protein